MANTLDSISIVGLRAAHFEQLYEYLKNAEHAEYYYGPPARFKKRHAEIKAWLEELCKAARDPNNKIPKK